MHFACFARWLANVSTTFIAYMLCIPSHHFLKLMFGLCIARKVRQIYKHYTLPCSRIHWLCALLYWIRHGYTFHYAKRTEILIKILRTRSRGHTQLISTCTYTHINNGEIDSFLSRVVYDGYVLCMCGGYRNRHPTLWPSKCQSAFFTPHYTIELAVIVKLMSFSMYGAIVKDSVCRIACLHPL